MLTKNNVCDLKHLKISTLKEVYNILTCIFLRVLLDHAFVY